MTRRVSALYGSRALADEAAARLRAAGFDDAAVSTAEPDPAAEVGPGMFDRLATLIAPGGVERERGFVVGVDADLERIDAAAVALEAGAERVEIAAPQRLAEHVVELSEGAEELIVEKQPVLREEIVMQVQAREHVEHVHDIVRRTEVEIERFGPDGTAQDASSVA